MTFANYITIVRILIIPVYAWFAWAYGESVLAGEPNETLRWTALTVFIIAAVGDAVDGYVARKFNQHTKLGAFLDPIADKFLILAAIIVLSRVPWGSGDWILPIWYFWMVLIRDLSIGFAVGVIKFFNKKVLIHVNLPSKLNTIAQLFTVGWVMLKWVPIAPIYPTMVCAALILLSSYAYVRETIYQLYEMDQDAEASA